jgi:transposase
LRGLMSDEEWAFLAPFRVRIGARSGRPPTDHRLLLDAIFWLARTGAPWRDLDARFGKLGTFYRQVRQWTIAGAWNVILHALNEGGQGGETGQISLDTCQRSAKRSGMLSRGRVRWLAVLSLEP